ncbi:MAG TPA: CYTH domain-containing protein [Chthoniobacterales bacterium]|jgi:CYTH domain-containing protein
MGLEIERKFLVKDDSWRALLSGPGRLLRQGYLVNGPPATVRVRVAETEAWLTIKGPVVGLSRAEYEYAIPLDDAQEMLETRCANPIIEKIRHRLPHEGLVIEIDEFLGANAELIIAEVELPSETTPFTPPLWFGMEVSRDFRYHNSQLSKRPHSTWA